MIITYPNKNKTFALRYNHLIVEKYHWLLLYFILHNHKHNVINIGFFIYHKKWYMDPGAIQYSYIFHFWHYFSYIVILYNKNDVAIDLFYMYVFICGYQFIFYKAAN